MTANTNALLRPELEPLRPIFNAALTSDCLDHLGYRNQVLGSDIAMISGERVMMGYAFPVRLEPVSAAPEVPYVGLLKALDAIGKDDVFIKPSARRHTSALWGELLSNACKFKGAAGALTDAPVRDVARTRALGFKVFGTGTWPIDINSRYEVVAHNVPGEIDGVQINPGDLIVGDVDGVVVGRGIAASGLQTIHVIRDRRGCGKDVRIGLVVVIVTDGLALAVAK